MCACIYSTKIVSQACNLNSVSLEDYHLAPALQLHIKYISVQVIKKNQLY